MEKVTVTENIKQGFLVELQHMLGDQHPGYCYQCSKCTSGCTVAKLLTDYRPHQIVGMVRLELADQLIHSKMIWNCSLCLKCKEICPQDVAPYDVIQALRNIAVSIGIPVPKGYIKMLEYILSWGFYQPPQEVMTRDFEFYNRSRLKLPPLPKPLNIEKFVSVLRETEFGEVLKEGER